MRDEDVLEVRLEEQGGYSWLQGTRGWTEADTRRVEQFGATQLRFVARRPAPAEGDDDGIASDAFTALRGQDLDPAASSLPRQRLFELDETVREHGWRRSPEPGEHWWSLRYTR